jgi:hypothetical protein
MEERTPKNLGDDRARRFAIERLSRNCTGCFNASSDALPVSQK